ncbi:zinc finger protein [Macleaya cordata]|uniref:RING-type E3 ubiquitin transferase n=1 Tax=Macleaya cordata TaxID=56857 RepID=A0A200QH37_MACCD|nr:zinc finger protein [Macleaya cordata]
MAADSDSETSFLEHLISSRNRDLSFFLPFILGFSRSSSRRETDDPNQEPGRPQDRIILINPFTQGMIVIESSRSFDALLREISEKEGLPPASKTSIDAMPKVEITEENGDLECAICLEGWEIGGEAREMPCKHRYHSNCIEKWLGIHGSCPVCRFKMPVDEEGSKKRSGDGGGEEEDRDRRGEREIWVTFSINNRRDSTNSTNSDSSSDRREEGAVVDGSSSNNQEN